MAFSPQKLLSSKLFMLILVQYANSTSSTPPARSRAPAQLDYLDQMNPPTSQFEGEFPFVVRYSGPCKDISTKMNEFYIFDVERNKCVSGFSADCPENMEIRSMPDNDTFGFCDCISYKSTVFDEIRNRCNLLFKQEHCSSGEWLIYNDKGKAICAENKCEELRLNQDEDILLFKGKCAKVGFPNPECGQYEVLMLHNGQPICSGEHAGHGGFAVAVPTLQCSPGTKWSFLTHNCQRTFEFGLS